MAAHLLLLGLLPQLLGLQPVLAHLLQTSTRDALQLGKLPFGLFLRLHQLGGLLIANLQRQPCLQDKPNTRQLVMSMQHLCRGTFFATLQGGVQQTCSYLSATPLPPYDGVV